MKSGAHPTHPSRGSCARQPAPCRAMRRHTRRVSASRSATRAARGRLERWSAFRLRCRSSQASIGRDARRSPPCAARRRTPTSPSRTATAASRTRLRRSAAIEPAALRTSHVAHRTCTETTNRYDRWRSTACRAATSPAGKSIRVGRRQPAPGQRACLCRLQRQPRARCRPTASADGATTATQAAIRRDSGVASSRSRSPTR